MQKAMEINVKTQQKASEKILADTTTSKSQKMKDLFDLGFEVKTISETMQVRYNFAYNVISNYVNMNKIELVQTEKSGKKEQIIALHKAGKTNKEISIELATNYNYVFNVLKTYKASLPKLTIDLTKINIDKEVHAEDPAEDQTEDQTEVPTEETK
jgi:hypothetical protein